MRRLRAEEDQLLHRACPCLFTCPASYALLTPAPSLCAWLGTLLSTPLITCNRRTVGTCPERLFHTRDSRWYAPLSTTSVHSIVWRRWLLTATWRRFHSFLHTRARSRRMALFASCKVGSQGRSRTRWVSWSAATLKPSGNAQLLACRLTFVFGLTDDPSVAQRQAQHLLAQHQGEHRRRVQHPGDRRAADLP